MCPLGSLWSVFSYPSLMVACSFNAQTERRICWDATWEKVSWNENVKTTEEGGVCTAHAPVRYDSWAGLCCGATAPRYVVCVVVSRAGCQLGTGTVVAVTVTYESKHCRWDDSRCSTLSMLDAHAHACTLSAAVIWRVWELWILHSVCLDHYHNITDEKTLS